MKNSCRSCDLPQLRIAVRCFGALLREHMAQEESELLPKISAAFELPWINDLITIGSPQGFGSEQSWSNALDGTTTATFVSMAFEASKKWGAAPEYLSQLPSSLQAALTGPLQAEFVRTKESLLIEACTA